MGWLFAFLGLLSVATYAYVTYVSPKITGMTDEQILEHMEKGFICRLVDLEMCHTTTDATPGTTPGSTTPATTPDSTPGSTPGSTTSASTPGSTPGSNTPGSNTPGSTPGSNTPGSTTSATTPGTTTPDSTPGASPPAGDAGTGASTAPAKPPRKVFYEGQTNWKFIHRTTENKTNCWKDWDFSPANDSDPIGQYTGAISTATRRPNSDILSIPNQPDLWCPVDAPQNAGARTQKRAKTLKDFVEGKTDTLIGVAGGIGIGLTEEIITKAIARSAKNAALAASKRVAAEASGEILEKASKSLAASFKTAVSNKLKTMVAAQAKINATAIAKKKVLGEMADTLGDQLRARLVKQLKNELSQEALERATKRLTVGNMAKAGGLLVKDFAQNGVRNMATKIATRIVQANQDAVARITAIRMLKSNGDNILMTSAKTLRTAMLSKLNGRILSEVQRTIASTVVSVIRNTIAKITSLVSINAAKMVVKAALTAIKSVLTGRLFFRAQARIFLAIGKSMTSLTDDIAKLAVALAKAGAKIADDIARMTLKSAMKSALKMARSLRPGPSTLFDMASMAMDLADVGGFQGFMTTDEYNQAVAESNENFRALLIAELGKTEAYKDVPNFENKIEYPTVLDPTMDFPDKDLKTVIRNKVDLLFEMSRIYTPHPAIREFLDTLNADLVSGKLKESQLSDTTAMEPYMAKIKMDDIVAVVNRDACLAAGGQEYTDSTGDKRCTHTKANCRAKYTWPLPKKTNSEADASDKVEAVYTAWTGDRCVIGNPEIRMMCDRMGATWNEATGVCDMNREWCLRKGGEWTASTNNCRMEFSQKAVEAIFGTSVTRLTKQVGNATIRPTVDLMKVILDPTSVDGTTVTYYKGDIRSAIDTNKCFDIGDGVRDGFPSKVKLWDCNSSDAQKFEWNPESKFIVSQSITQGGSPICLENPYGTGGLVHAVECNGEANQKWEVDPIEKSIRSSVAPDSFYMDHHGGNTGNGTNIWQRTKNGNYTSFTFGTQQVVDQALLNKKVASLAMNVVFLGNPVGANLVETGYSAATVLIDAVTAIANIGKSFQDALTIRCNNN